MRNRILAIAAVATIAAPAAAFAQDLAQQDYAQQDAVTVGVAPGPPVVMPGDAPGITVEQRPAFREYVIREHVPTYTIPDRVVVGGVLPDTVTYYDVPQTYGVTPYRYTVVNGETVLVEPRTRRIMQVVD